MLFYYKSIKNNQIGLKSEILVSAIQCFHAQRRNPDNSDLFIKKKHKYHDSFLERESTKKKYLDAAIHVVILIFFSNFFSLSRCYVTSLVISKNLFHCKSLGLG